MNKTLNEIVEQLKNSNKKVQLIYAFNGTGKTRLSRKFIKEFETDEVQKKVLYYNAFTEDLFYWSNNLDGEFNPRLNIQTNSFTDWVLQDQGQDQNIIETFQNYTNSKLTPKFNSSFSEVTFSIQSGDATSSDNLKISKGEESNFIWSVFYTLLEQVVEVLNVPDLDNRETDEFNQLEYIFIDDPISSLDENYVIELAVNLAALIKNNKSELKFIVTTHSALFYNVLYSELNTKECYLLKRLGDGTFELEKKHGGSNTSFSYHIYLKLLLEEAISQNKVQKYHFMLLRNLYEKTASFLGYTEWSSLLPDDKTLYLKRIIQFTSHSTLASTTVAEPSEPEKKTVSFLLEHLINTYQFSER